MQIRGAGFGEAIDFFSQSSRIDGDPKYGHSSELCYNFHRNVERI